MNYNCLELSICLGISPFDFLLFLIIIIATLVKKSRINFDFLTFYF